MANEPDRQAVIDLPSPCTDCPGRDRCPIHPRNRQGYPCYSADTRLVVILAPDPEHRDDSVQDASEGPAASVSVDFRSCGDDRFGSDPVSSEVGSEGVVGGL